MTMTLIETKTLGTAAASIAFTSIPQTYTDLLVLVSSRGNDGSTNGAILVSFNGDNQLSNGSTRWLQGSGSAASSSSASFAVSGITSANATTADTFGSGQFYICNYTSTSSKSISQDWVSENNATQAFQRITAGLSTLAAAITSITLYIDSQSFMAGTTVSIYGILKGSSGGVTVS